MWTMKALATGKPNVATGRETPLGRLKDGMLTACRCFEAGFSFA